MADERRNLIINGELQKRDGMYQTTSCQLVFHDEED
jgi:hypothetical protein